MKGERNSAPVRNSSFNNGGATKQIVAIASPAAAARGTGRQRRVQLGRLAGGVPGCQSCKPRPGEGSKLMSLGGATLVLLPTIANGHF